MAEKDHEESLANAADRIASLKEKNKGLIALIEEQSQVLISLRGENEKLLQQQDEVSQALLAKIYQALSDAPNDREHIEKLSQADITRFCQHVALNFGLSDEQYQPRLKKQRSQHLRVHDPHSSNHSDSKEKDRGERVRTRKDEEEAEREREKAEREKAERERAEKEKAKEERARRKREEEDKRRREEEESKRREDDERKKREEEERREREAEKQRLKEEKAKEKDRRRHEEADKSRDDNKSRDDSAKPAKTATTTEPADATPSVEKSKEKKHKRERSGDQPDENSSKPDRPETHKRDSSKSRDGESKIRDSRDPAKDAPSHKDQSAESAKDSLPTTTSPLGLLSLAPLTNIPVIREHGALSARERETPQRSDSLVLSTKSNSFSKKTGKSRERNSPEDRVHHTVAERATSKSSKASKAEDVFSTGTGNAGSTTPNGGSVRAKKRASEDRASSLAGEEYRPSLERFAFFLGDSFLEAISYHPSRKVYAAAEECAKRHNIPFNDCTFRGGDGLNFVLLPTTLQREIPDKKFVFISNNLGVPNSTAPLSHSAGELGAEHRVKKKQHPPKAPSVDSSKVVTNHSHHHHHNTHNNSGNLTNSTNTLPMTVSTTSSTSGGSPKKQHALHDRHDLSGSPRGKAGHRNSGNGTKSPHKAVTDLDLDKSGKTKIDKTASSPALTPSKAIRTQIDYNEIRDKTIGAWSLPLRTSHLFGDLCRLAARISFSDTRPGHDVQYSPPEGLTSNLQYAKHLLQRVIAALEAKEVVEKVQAVLDQADTATDGALWIGSVFQVLGDDCGTAKLLMATHQGVITSAATQIKVVLFSNTNQFTKDVQGKEGWLIQLALSEREVLVSHMRKEQSMIPGNNEYSFEWRLDIYLKQSFQAVEKILLKASNLKVGPNCDPILKKKIQDCLDQVKSNQD